MKGKMTPKKSDIEGGLTSIDEEETMNEKDNLKQLIMEMDEHYDTRI
jgi:hypothetical protein